MTPTCVVCRTQPVQRRSHWSRVPKRGLRLIDGVSWNWFCSKRCSGLDCGRTNIQSGRVQEAITSAALARRQQARQRQLAEIADEVLTLEGYGVPRSIAVALLTRLVQRAMGRAYNARYYEQVAKPRRVAQVFGGD